MRRKTAATRKASGAVEMTDAVLGAGDQVVFDGQHRFVLEFPAAQIIATPVPEPESAPVDAGDGGPLQASPATRLPWLLLAALLLGLVLAALLWFGAR